MTGEFDNSDIFFLNELMTAKNAGLPSHERSVFNLVKRRRISLECEGSNKPPKGTYIFRPLDPNTIQSVHGICKGNCGNSFTWNVASQQWQKR